MAGLNTQASFERSVIEQDVSAIDFWINEGADIHFKDAAGLTALEKAVSKGHFKSALFLLQRKEITVNDAALALDALEVWRLEYSPYQAACRKFSQHNFLYKVIDAIFGWEGLNINLNSAIDTRNMIMMHCKFSAKIQEFQKEKVRE